MELKTLLNLAAENKDLKIENAFFHGEKIEALLKTLKKHHVNIQVQTSFLNPGNCPDLVIEYTGPSVGRFVFHGQVYSRPELKMNEKKAKIKEKENEKAEKKRQKELKAQSKSSEFSGPLFELPREFFNNGYIYTKEKHGVLSDFVIVQVFTKGYFMVRIDENGCFELQNQKVELKNCKQVRI
jgi:hypothetical protein